MASRSSSPIRSSRRAPEAGMTRVNFIAERRAPEGMAETADWNHPVDPAPIVELFADWRFDWLDVPAVIASADRILEYPMVDRDPLPRWTFGRTTLLGDAAHAPVPERLQRGIPGHRRRSLPRLPPRHGSEHRRRARRVRGGSAPCHDPPVGHDPAARPRARHAARPRSGTGRVRGHPRRDLRGRAARDRRLVQARGRIPPRAAERTGLAHAPGRP